MIITNTWPLSWLGVSCAWLFREGLHLFIFYDLSFWVTDASITNRILTKQREQMSEHFLKIQLESGGADWVKVTHGGCRVSGFHCSTRRLAKWHSVVAQHRQPIWFDMNPDYRCAPRGVSTLNEQMLPPLPLLSCRLLSFGYICSRVMDDREAGCSLHQTYQAPLGTIFCPFAW